MHNELTKLFQEHFAPRTTQPQPAPAKPKRIRIKDVYLVGE